MYRWRLQPQLHRTITSAHAIKEINPFKNVHIVKCARVCVFSIMLARKGLLPDGFLLTRLAEDQNQPNRSRSKCQRARFITKSGSCNVAHKNIREQVRERSLNYYLIQPQAAVTLQGSWIIEIPSPNSHRSLLKSANLNCFQSAAV